MLSERQLQDVLSVFEKRMQKVIEQYLVIMGEHIRDIGKLTPSDVNRLVQLKRVNANMEKIKLQVARAAKQSLDDVETAFRAVAESDYRFAAEVFGEDHTPSVKANKYLERILKAQLRITKQELANISRTTIVPDLYRDAVDLAIQTVQAGITDYNSAIRTAMKAAAQAGLRVEYPSGLTRRLDTAIRMNILDGVRAINRDVMEQAGKEFRADGIELSAHALCAEDHLPYQGLQMPMKEFERLQNRLDRPFGMWNCKHFWWPILMGISQPTHTREELRAYTENSNEPITIDGVTKTRYQWTQEQRRLETHIRYQKDAANLYKASGDMVGRRNAQATINALRERYARVSEAAGLREDVSRMRVAGFARVKFSDVNSNSNTKRPGYIQLGINGRFVNSKEKLYRYAEKIKEEPGFQDFVSHANPRGFSIFLTVTEDGYPGDESVNYTPAEFANMIRNSTSYKGGNVRLVCCQSGHDDDGAAQQVANLLGVTVKAPTEIVNLDENGNIFLSDSESLAEMWYNGIDVKQSGKWRIFYPQKE